MVRPSNPESTVPEPRADGISRATAHLLAEGSHWLATGEVFHDQTEPMGRLLARLDHLVPSERYFDWLISPNEDLGGHRPMDYVDADQLAPLDALLDRMEAHSDSVNGSNGERG